MIIDIRKISIIGTAGMDALSYLPMMPGIRRQNELGDIEKLDGNEHHRGQ